MLQNNKVNEAFDRLNLPRDASMQAVHDRILKLRDRLSEPSDSERLAEAEQAFAIIEAHDAAKRAQKDMASIHNRTRSERDLDTKLISLSQEAIGTSVKRPVAVMKTEEVTKQKTEDGIKEEEQNSPESVPGASSTPPQGDEIVFEKLNGLLRDETKYIRAVNVLCNVIQSIIESARVSPSIVDMIFNTLEIVMSAKISTAPIDGHKLPLANSSEDNRKVVSKVFSVITLSPELVDALKSKGYFWDVWMHASEFRNTLYQFDNFQFSKKCKELISLIDGVDLDSSSDKGERWLSELSITTEVMCSKYVSRIIPGRQNEVKSTMTEIYKLTRVKNFPKQFKDTIAELQLSLSS
jgi:hypothetical protein